MARVATAVLAAALLLVAAAPGGSAPAPSGAAPHHAPDGSGYDPQPPPPPVAPSPPPPAGKNVLVATVGPAFTITLRTPAGKRVTKLRAGRYTIQVSDRSEHHNFRLTGPGVKKATGVPFVGTRTWTGVRFRKGKTYRFRCDPHLSSMKGSFRAT